MRYTEGDGFGGTECDQIAAIYSQETVKTKINNDLESMGDESERVMSRCGCDVTVW